MAKINSTRTAVLFHDGTFWVCGVYSYRNLSPVIFSEKVKGQHLPEKLLKWAKENEAKQLKIITAPDVLNIQFKLPEGLTPEEVNTAIAWESSSTHAAIDTSGIHFGAVKAEAFVHDSTHKQLFIAMYSRVELQSYIELAKKYNMLFLGEGCLQFILMKLIKDKHPNSNLLFVNANKSLIYDTLHSTPGQIIKNLPMGLSSFVQQSKRWGDRLKKRLSELQNRELIVVTPDSTPIGFLEIFDSIIPELKVKFISLSSLEDECMAIANHENINDNVNIAALTGISISKKSKMPRSLLFGIFILLGTISIVTVWATLLHLNKATMQNHLKDNKQFNKEQKQLTQQLAKLSLSYDKKSKILNLIKGNQRVSKPILNFLDALTETLPKYCRIKSIRTEGNRIIMQGYSARQIDLTNFISKLQRRVKEDHLKLLPNGILERSTDGTELSFTYTIIGMRGNAQ